MSRKKEIIRKLTATAFVIAFMAAMLYFAFTTLLGADIFDPLLKLILLSCTGVLCLACVYFLYCKIYEVVALLKGLDLDARSKRPESAPAVAPAQAHDKSALTAKKPSAKPKPAKPGAKARPIAKAKAKPTASFAAKLTDKVQAKSKIFSPNSSTSRTAADADSISDKTRREEAAIKHMSDIRAAKSADKPIATASPSPPQGADADVNINVADTYTPSLADTGSSDSSGEVLQTIMELQASTDILAELTAATSEVASAEPIAPALPIYPPPKPKLQRGRPPKEVTEARRAAEAATKAEYERLGLALPKPRRGRPPKLETQQPAKAPAAMHTSVGTDSATPAVPPVAVHEPRSMQAAVPRRGRPPKEVTEARRAAEKAEKAEYARLGIEPPKPRRGRPPKAKPEDEKPFAVSNK